MEYSIDKSDGKITCQIFTKIYIHPVTAKFSMHFFDIRLFLNDKSSITQHIIQDNIINELEKILFIYNRPEWVSDLLQNQIIHNHRPISKES